MVGGVYGSVAGYGEGVGCSKLPISIEMYRFHENRIDTLKRSLFVFSLIPTRLKLFFLQFLFTSKKTIKLLLLVLFSLQPE